MSVNITVAVPLETLSAFFDGTGRQQATEAVTKAVIESLEAMPYEVTPKAGNNGRAAAEITQGATKDGSSTTPMASPPANVSFHVKTLTGQMMWFTMHTATRFSELASTVQFRNGIPPDMQLYIYRGKLCYGGCKAYEDYGHTPDYTLGELDEDELWVDKLMETLKGS